MSRMGRYSVFRPHLGPPYCVFSPFCGLWFVRCSWQTEASLSRGCVKGSERKGSYIHMSGSSGEVW